VQAVKLSPEMRMVVVRVDNLPSRGKEKPTPFIRRKAESPYRTLWQVRKDTTGVRDQGMYSEG